MSNYRTGPGWNFAPEYQCSGTPFVTSSNYDEISSSGVVSVKFPTVTRWVQIRNIGAKELRVGFTENGVDGRGGSVSGSAVEAQGNSRNYYIIPTGSLDGTSTVLWELRCDKLFFTSGESGGTGFSLVAGLTNIRPSEFFKLTGSLGFRGVG